MELWIEQNGLTKILFIEPDSYSESHVFEDFARDDELLTAQIKQGPGYTYPHIEIRKES